MHLKQRTISSSVKVSGIGLHTGHKVNVVFTPAKANDGIVFTRIDMPGQPMVRLGDFASISGGEAGRYSSLKIGDGQIYTIEHMMGALAGLGIDNIAIAMDGDEAPGLDGSAIEFVKALKLAGIVDLDADKKFIEIKEAICVTKNGASVMIVPADDFKISYALEYPHPLLRSTVTYAITQDVFERDIAPCRTFCLKEEADALLTKGLGQGANHENTLVFGPNGIVGNTARFADEPARHKLMDCIGDLYLLGAPVKGHVFAFKSGHNLNRELLKKIVEQRDRFASKREPLKLELKEGGGMDVRGIMNIIPHRYPFLLVDRIVEMEPGKRAVAIKNVTMNEAFFQGHFPSRPVMPGVLMVEAMAQVVGVTMLSNPALLGKLAFFMSVDGVKFRRVIEPGDQVVMEVEIIRARSRTAQAKGVCKVDGQIVCEAEMGFAFGE
ncbi:MAG: UDP-3-O-[3-hydroxymyristoyl] N-acetylglucosamine deacetylase [Candidatus Omnitrophica bacterium]|nr:UDP-3-O-[3-hydroxymyristoyl] N-acetylglucosamine deacetylase [Candidatus Omnitrophota bacterium]